MQKQDIKIGDLVWCSLLHTRALEPKGFAGVVSQIKPTLGWDNEKKTLQENLNRDQYTCTIVVSVTGKTIDIRAKHLEIISKGE